MYHNIVISSSLGYRIHILFLLLSLVGRLQDLNTFLYMLPQVFEVSISLESSMGKLQFLLIKTLIHLVAINFVDVICLDVGGSDSLVLSLSLCFHGAHTALRVHHFSDGLEIIRVHYIRGCLY